MRFSTPCAIFAVSVNAQHAQHLAMHTREFFYVGGQYAGAPGTEVMAGQMYVELLRPQRELNGNWPPPRSIQSGRATVRRRLGRRSSV
jgi:hypothetical protein